MNNEVTSLKVKFEVETLCNGEVFKTKEIGHVINAREDLSKMTAEQAVSKYCKHLIKAYAPKEVNAGTFMNPDYETYERRLGKILVAEEHIVEESNEPFDWSNAYEEDKRYNYNG